ncbi:MAG: AAA family ATPase [Faecousia sp.]
MAQWLPRGLTVAEETRIKKMISEGENWQIYATNLDTYVLAVTNAVHRQWVRDYALADGLFTEVTVDETYKMLCSTGNYLISSLEKGPFPENNGQIEAFSITFRTTLESFPDMDLHDAIYIEEYSLLLPGSQTADAVPNDCIYGKWLTGGVAVSAKSFPRIARLMSWLPEEVLRRSFELAGFPVAEDDADRGGWAETRRTVSACEDAAEEKSAGALPDGRFTLTGRPELEQFFQDNIIDIVLHREEYERMGIPFPGATLLYGPPGCGKTYAVEKLSEYLGWRRFDIDSSSVASSYIHDTSRKISEVFNSAIKAAPSIVVIDEMEAFLSDRSNSGPASIHHMEEVAEFLRKIPEASAKGVLVFAMTNMLSSIDPAILRKGRFDHIIEVKMASRDDIAALLAVRFKELPIAEDVDAAGIAAKLEGHPLSDVTFVLREAGRIAVKEGCGAITASCFENALRALPKKEEKRKIGFDL